MSNTVLLNSINELLQKAKEASAFAEKKWIYIAFTDTVDLKEWKPEAGELFIPEERLGRLLEIRIFWPDAEYKAFRGNIGTDFHYRVLAEDANADYYDEEQFLDGNMGKLQIRNYVSYYEKSGQAYVSDWRMVSYKEGR